MKKIEPGDVVVYHADTLLGRGQMQAEVQAVSGDTIDLGRYGTIQRDEVEKVYKGGFSAFGPLENDL